MKRRQKSKLINPGTSSRPRLSVFRSNNHIYAQLIDDSAGQTKVSASDLVKAGKTEAKISSASKVGESLALAAKRKKITKVVFDRSSYRYHGRVKALAEGARKGGLVF